MARHTPQTELPALDWNVHLSERGLVTNRQSGPWREISGSHVFRSKLRAPNAQRLLRRADLIDQLATCSAMPLTLVIGPAGTGKTSLVATWVAESETPTAWLSLDAGDHDPAHFWTGVLASLETLLPEGLPQASALLQRPGFIDEAVVALLDDLEAHDLAPSTLVIDNVQVIDDNPEAVSSFATFVQHLPPWLHVVLLARRRPRLPLARMRARGELGELGYADLKFLDDEAAVLLRSFAPTLDNGTVQVVVSRSDGWAAGIQLAGLAARSARGTQVEGPGDPGELFVSDYLWHEVFADERPELVDTLLDVSVVERVNPDLARCLAGTDAAALLSEAESRGLFITRLHASDWFEIHTLVREQLRAELVRRSPAHAADLHMRCARWFEETGEVALALDQWIRAEQPREALRLLAAKMMALYDSGLETTITRTIAQLPPTLARDDFEAALEFAWCTLLVSPQTFLQAVGRASTWSRQLTELNPTLGGRLTMLQSIAATVRGDWASGSDLARRAMSQQGDSWPSDLLGRFGLNMIARNIALSESWTASEEIRTLRHKLSRDPERRLAFEGTRALGESLAGHPVDALRITAGVRESANASGMSILRLELAAAEAIAHRELGDRLRAQAEFVALGALSPGPVRYAVLLAELELAQMHLDDADVSKAESAFIRAAEYVETEFDGSGAHNWIGRVGTLVTLSKGDVDRAHHWASAIDDPFWAAISQARVQLAMGDVPGALHRVEESSPRCPRHEVIQGLLRARALSNREESVEQAAAAAELASECSLVQTVASEGLECLRLIELAAWRVPPAWLDRVRRAASATGIARLESLGMVEKLTDREREVLRLLPSRLTLHEIADELFISMNTLKFHLKVIYRKLGCSSRTEAAALSQEAKGLLRRQMSETLRR